MTNEYGSMLKITPKKIISSDSGDDFHFEIFPGDVFISVHSRSESKCMGVYYRKFELSGGLLNFFLKEVLNYFKVKDYAQLEIKILGSSDAIKIVNQHLSNCVFAEIKKVNRDESNPVEVQFFPGLNKLRIHKSESLEKNSKYKVLIVDDSKTIRNILTKIFNSDPMFIVCGTAERPSEVEQLINTHHPDLITMDIHMPEKDGVELVKELAPKYKIPTIMISSISMSEGPKVLEALENGAVDYIQKPELSEIANVTPIIIEKAKAAVTSKMRISVKPKVNITPKIMAQDNSISTNNSLIVIGSSTGGTEALREILTAMPANIPPILIVQHIPPIFSLAFAKRLNDLCSFEVKEAEDGDEVLPNRVLIAPGGMQMKLIVKNKKQIVEINNDEPVNRFKPSVDYLFNSVSKALYNQTIAVILTGMGKDGAKEMLELHKKGVETIAQDEESCVVFGMPKEAIHLNAVDYIEPLPEIANRLKLLLSKSKSNKQKAIS